MNADLVTLARGFADPVHDANGVFRAVLDALARPGVPRAPDCTGLDDLDPAIPRPLAAVLLALADFETAVWIDADPGRHLEALLRFHCGAPLVARPRDAAFAVVRDGRCPPPLADFSWGVAEYPDRGATLLIAVPDLEGGRPLALTGPGIDGVRRFAPAGLPDRFWEERRAMQAEFPCGVDCLLFDARRVAGLPRTTIAAFLES